MTLPYYIIILITIAYQKGTEEDFPIIVTSGAFFDEIPETIMYEKSILLTYTQIIENNSLKNNVEINLGIGNYCKNKQTKYCNIVNQFLILLKIINKKIKENEIDMFEAFGEFFKNNKRSKRGIQPIVTILQ